VSFNEIVVRPENFLIGSVLLSAIWMAWIGGGLAFLKQVWSDPVVRSHNVGYVFVASWVIGVVFLGFVLAWILFGAQVMWRTEGVLSIRNQIFGIAIGRTREFVVDDVCNVKVEETVSTFRGKRAVYYVIAFDYRGYRYRPFLRMSRERAESLLSGRLGELLG